MDEPESTFLVVNLYTQMAPFGRHEIEDEIEEALGPLGEVTGGGSFIKAVESGPQCNIDLEVNDVAQAIAVIRSVLRKLQVDPRTEIIQYEPERICYPVYQD